MTDPRTWSHCTCVCARQKNICYFSSAQWICA